SDTPGFIDEPAYKMHKMMNSFITSSFDDADIILFITDPYEPLNEEHNLIKRISMHSSPAILIINKKDLLTPDALESRKAELTALLPGRKIHAVSALKGDGIESLMSDIASMLPEGPAFYPKDQLTDRPER